MAPFSRDSLDIKITVHDTSGTLEDLFLEDNRPIINAFGGELDNIQKTADKVNNGTSSSSTSGGLNANSLVSGSSPLGR